MANSVQFAVAPGARARPRTKDGLDRALELGVRICWKWFSSRGFEFVAEDLGHVRETMGVELIDVARTEFREHGFAP